MLQFNHFKVLQSTSKYCGRIRLGVLGNICIVVSNNGIAYKKRQNLYTHTHALECDLSVLLLRKLVVVRRQQSESIENALDME